ncbi:GyrI-like domain-containing protein [uncultured Devosia sp.]|uniref:GyrI-like domain-containing protein n=1 Tax=uncultured Devosia sp. TaxID=211434 RepID=UPI0035CBD99D
MTQILIATRKPQPFAAIMLRVSQPDIAAKAPPLIGEVIAWIKAHGGETVGAPFFNYVNFYPDDTMDMQVGMPTATLMAGDGEVTTGTLPEGRYCSLIHDGPYHELHQANMTLLDWAKGAGHQLDGTVDGDRFIGATRLEIYLSDPGESPSGNPVTEVRFRLAD